MTADTIVPDDKDWTWVLDEPCPDCGFDASAMQSSEVGKMIRANADAFGVVLRGPVEAVRRRPNSSTWSPLEYGAHVRDVFELFDQRLTLMLERDDPQFENWNQDNTAIERRYDEQDPETVANELCAAARQIADAFDGVDGEQWHRSGRRSDGAVFTVESFARYLIHDPIHHLWDVTGASD